MVDNPSEVPKKVDSSSNESAKAKQNQPQSADAAAARQIVDHVMGGQSGTPMQRLAAGGEPAKMSLLRGSKERQVNLGNVVRLGRENVPVSEEMFVGIPPLTIEEFSQLNEEQLQVLKEEWGKSKVERNAMIAHFSGDIWRITRDISETWKQQKGSPLGLLQFPQYDMTKPLIEMNTPFPVTLEDVAKNSDPANFLRRQMQVTFMEASKVWGDMYENPSARDHVSQIDRDNYQRFKDILSIGYNQNLSLRSPRMVINNGIGTATQTIWGVYDVIPRVFKAQAGRDITQEELEAIAESSGSLITALAAGHIDITVPVLDSLQAEKRALNSFDRLDANKFTLVEQNGKWTLKVRAEALEAIDESGTRYIDQKPAGPTTGCPFIQAPGEHGGSAMQELLAWSLDIAKQAYFPLFAQQRQQESNS